MKEVFALIHEEATSQTWSKGVEISRLGLVEGQSINDEEIVFRVSEQGKNISPLVTIWPLEEDWNCDCGSIEDPCQHVTASIIALKRAHENGEQLPQSSLKPGQICYHFNSTEENYLRFTRTAKFPDREEPLILSLAALAQGTAKGPKVFPSKQDIEIDLAIDNRRKGGAFEDSLNQKLIELLQESEHVYLNGNPIKCSQDYCGYRLKLSDYGAGVWAQIYEDDTIKIAFKNGLALNKNNELAIFKQNTEAISDFDELVKGRAYINQELIELSTEWIPLWKKWLKIDTTAKNIPTLVKCKPQIIWRSRKINHKTLSMTPLIAYGSPVIATIEQNQLRIVSDNISIDQRQIPLRDLDAEVQLRTAFNNSQYDSPLEHEQIYTSSKAVKVLGSLAKRGEIVIGEGQNFFQLSTPLELSIGIKKAGELEKSDRFQLDVTWKQVTDTNNAHPPEEGPHITFSETILNQWQQGETHVPLLDGSWAPLPLDWLKKHGPTLERLLSLQKEDGLLQGCALPELSKLASDLEVELPFELAKITSIAKDMKLLPARGIPSDLKAHLRDYQKLGVYWFNYLKELGMGALLADDMGLGKTLQSIALLEKHSLVIAPTSVLKNWQQEITKFRPNLNVNIYHGGNRSLTVDCDVTITSYGVARLDQEQLSQMHWHTIVLDEAQTIKNPYSQNAQACFALKGHFRIALSGTPIENRLDDLWSIFHFINPGLLGPYSKFKDHYGQAIYSDHEVHKKLIALTQFFILRRLKKEVAKELPPKTEVIKYCELYPEDKELYDTIKAATKKDLLKNFDSQKNTLQILEVLLRLRQVCCHSSLLPEHKASSSAKVDQLISCLHEGIDNGHKSLVFSQWTGFLDLIAAQLEKEEISYLRIDGSTRNRQELIDRFQKSRRIKVFLLSLKAAGVGLNLTAADHVYIMDPWWNPAVENQASDRSYRIGQDKPVLVTRFVAQDTIEERVLDLQFQKKFLAESIVLKEDSKINFREDDLLALLD